MKTILASTPPSGSDPLQNIEANKREGQPVFVSVNAAGTAIVPAGGKHIADAPENWDESWFAHYE